MEPNNRIINAVFSGQDGSLGYKNGKMYTLLLNVYPADKSILVREVTGKCGGCEYSSEKTFLTNWLIGRRVLTEKINNKLVNWKKFKQYNES
jgi:hypothetical protein